MKLRLSILKLITLQMHNENLIKFIMKDLRIQSQNLKYYPHQSKSSLSQTLPTQNYRNYKIKVISRDSTK